MKKALVVLLSLLCVMSSVLFAGGSSEGSSGEIVLDFPTWQAEEGGFALFWKDMVEQFEASHPNVKINMTQIPFNQFTDILITRYSANDAPDITHIASRFFEQFASQGWFENLDPYFEEAGILEDWTSLQSSMVYNGHNEGLLVLGYGFVLYYNEQILNEAGVSVPTTVDELKDAILAIEALGNPDISAFGVTTMQHSNTYQDFSNFVVGEGSALIKDGKYNLTSPEVIKAAEDYNFVASRAPKGVSTEMLRQLFVDGKVAMIIDGSFVVPLLETADEDISLTSRSRRLLSSILLELSPTACICPLISLMSARLLSGNSCSRSHPRRIRSFMRTIHRGHAEGFLPLRVFPIL